jgi:hypothetical protein
MSTMKMDQTRISNRRVSRGFDEPFDESEENALNMEPDDPDDEPSVELESELDPNDENRREKTTMITIKNTTIAGFPLFADAIPNVGFSTLVIGL